MNIGWAAILIGLATLAWALWILATEEPSQYEEDFDDSFTPVDLRLLDRGRELHIGHYDQDDAS